MQDARRTSQSIDKQMLIAQKMIEFSSGLGFRQASKHFQEESENIQKRNQQDNDVVIFDPNVADGQLLKAGSDDLKAELKLLSKEKNIKPLAVVDNQVLLDLSNLEEKFPNFGEVISLFRKAMKLILCGKYKAIALPPLLIIGPPGVGKTRFMSELGKVLQTGFYSIDMSNVSAGFVLSGNTSQWGNSKPGFVSNTLRSSKVANPLILVDEIDKASDDSRHNPVNCFLGLLQKHSAKSFKDEFLEVEMDCSYINWMASANYEERIEPAILSRMRVVKIALPTPEQTVPIVKSIYEELLSENQWQDIFETNLDSAVVDKLKGQAPRGIAQILEYACFNAFDRQDKPGNKCVVTCDDIALPEENKKRRRIGFIQD